jgi:hypothetical protein
MTPEEHNKFVGFAHLGYGIFSMLLWLGFSFFFVLVWGLAFLFDPKVNNDSIPLIFFVMFGAAALLFASIFSLPSIIAGYGHLKKRKWAKVWGLIAAVLSASNFPFGTAVAVYSLWFNFGEEGKKFYEQQNRENPYNTPRGLNESPQFGWTAKEQTSQQREFDFANRTQPPNWRDDSVQ